MHFKYLVRKNKLFHKIKVQAVFGSFCMNMLALKRFNHIKLTVSHFYQYGSAIFIT